MGALTTFEPPAGGWPSMWICVSATIRRDYCTRRVFPELHERGCSNDDLSSQRVAEIVDDAIAMRARPCPPGLKGAYTCLLRDITRRADLVVQHAAERAAAAEASAKNDAEIRRHATPFTEAFNNYPDEWPCWKVGDRARSICGRDVVIVEGYSLYKVRDQDGPDVATDGTRFSWRRGYRARAENSDKVYFYPAAQLRNRDDSPSHLRLVRQWTPEEIERQEVGVRALVVHRDEAAEARAVARMFEACGIKRPVVLTSSKAIAESGRS